ncbi:hypothetical protein P775_04825 [Puniceibacterium antarcticum]|uniref:Transposase IS4-like domain-containing protein n=1 Tax=Puniceibacterium antarcticum TaxID=1206336 RepID=A0A2G8RIC6_9RHOB|nr:hypothetical protein P775_04825 [Puniceibacterium antarcticum]
MVSTSERWKSDPSIARQAICIANLPRGEITGSNTGDAPMLPHLLNQIPHDQEIGSVTADGAYDTRRCHNAIHRPAVHFYMHERGRSWSLCGDTATQKCPAMEANHCRRHRQERRTPRIKISVSSTLAKLERIPPPELRRDKDALR